MAHHEHHNLDALGQLCVDPALVDLQPSRLSGTPLGQVPHGLTHDLDHTPPSASYDGARQDDELSDTDSVELDFEQSMDRFRDSVLDFKPAQDLFPDSSHVIDRQHLPGTHAQHASLKVIRGPRKAAEPTGDIRLRMGQATDAFIQERYEDARAIVSEIIRINAETYEAWTLLALVFEELGDLDKALMALMFAAHMRPKDVQAWIKCAEFALNKTGDRREQYLPSATFCYASAIRADAKCIQARYGKAEVHLERGKIGSAISEYSYIFRADPSDTKIVRILAELLVDQGNDAQAKEVYSQCVEHLKSLTGVGGFTWTHASAYAALYEDSEDYATGIRVLKSVARWLAVGQGNDSYWDNVTTDDREWDVDDDRKTSEGRTRLAGYGAALPLELRIQLGLYRLRLTHYDEAIRHFSCLRPWDASQDSARFSHPDLFYKIADELRMAGCFQEALTFYTPLLEVPEAPSAALFMSLGTCYVKQSLYPQAEESFQTALQMDESSIDARRELAQMYEDLDEHEEALLYLNEVRSIRLAQQGKRSTRGIMQAPQYAEIRSKPARPIIKPKRPRYIPRRVGDSKAREKQEAARTKQLQELYSTLQQHQEAMRAGNPHAMYIWLDAAKEMTDDFRSCMTFYPWETRSKRQREVDEELEKSLTISDVVDADLNERRQRLSKSLDESTKGLAKELPPDYRGIAYDDWLDIFLEYAVRLSMDGRTQEAYDMCQSAYEARPFEQISTRRYMITVCMYTLALLANDDRSCSKIARIFMNEPNQFGTDSYRMFAAVARICQSPIAWYTSGPTQKYMLRQIKSMDAEIKANQGAGNGEHLTISLLMLYGHILYTGTSYSYALNYFFRAYALDPESSTINLNLGVTYIHYALKRQAGNRQYLILQGFTFLNEYYERRLRSDIVGEREEAHFNMARAYHLVGLAHLAMPYYMQALEERQLSGTEATEGEMSLKINYNM